MNSRYLADGATTCKNSARQQPSCTEQQPASIRGEGDMQDFGIFAHGRLVKKSGWRKARCAFEVVDEM